MRLIPCLLSVLIVDCSGEDPPQQLSGPPASPENPNPPAAPEEPAPPPEPEPPAPPQLFDISGVIVDSLAGGGVEGALVAIQTKTATTDFLGSFQIQAVEEGTHTLSVTHDAYRRIDQTLNVTGNTTVNLQAWRVAPWPTMIWIDDWTITVRWVDLDGDFKSGGSWCTVAGPGFQWGMGAYTSSQIDALTMEYSYESRPDANFVAVSLTDQSDHTTRIECLPGWNCYEVE